MKTRIIILFCLFILLVVGSFLFYSQFKGFGQDLPRERFVVALNTSDQQVFDDLVKAGFVRNQKLFEFVLNCLCKQRSCPDPNQKIQPGAYLLTKSDNAYQLAGSLLYGPFQKWLIIPPGKRVEQVALILQKTLNWDFATARSFIALAPEGYLFPDTYLINSDADPALVVQRFKSNFNDHFDAEIQKQLLTQDIRNDTAIKIASLIERESGSLADKPIIAGVIWNRLLTDKRLEIDATVQYAIASDKLADEGLQTLADFDFWPRIGPGVVRTVKSDYNTYLVDGLPPGPICSPSLESIKAVINPAETKALYYLHSADKQIHTAETYQEHLENIEKYLQ